MVRSIIQLIQSPTNLLLLTLTSHFLTDFHLQTEKLSTLKVHSKKHLFIHFLITLLPLGLLFTYEPTAWSYLLGVWLSHCIIDYLKTNDKLTQSINSKWLFISDQILHLFMILFLYVLFINHTPMTSTLNQAFIKVILLLVIITKPINISFRILFERFQPSDSTQLKIDETISGGGAIIGNLERLLIALLIHYSQFQSIGLIFTAKSIARYNKIAESDQFAEYFLIGSLFSVLGVLIVYVFIFGI